jgi:DNA-binding NarL/FixJ family response regulator
MLLSGILVSYQCLPWGQEESPLVSLVIVLRVSSGASIMVSILIADDHEVVRDGVQRLVESHRGWEVVAIAADGKEAVQKALETRPDVAIVDYSLPLSNGIDVTRQIRVQLPRTEVLIFTMHDSEALIAELLQAGARGYLLKSDANLYLIAAIEALSLHKPYFTSQVSEALIQSFSSGRASGERSPLTARERQVVQLISEGYSNKVVAKLLSISSKTVETHRMTVMRKLNLGSSANLVRYAIRNRIIEA